MAETSVPAVDLDSARRGIRFYSQLLPELRALPGVRSAAATTMVPGYTSSNGIYFVDHLPANYDITGPNAIFTVVTPGCVCDDGNSVEARARFQRCRRLRCAVHRGHQ